MLCELSPQLTFQQIVVRELQQAGVDPAALDGRIE
jgi:hypothetical protein